MPHHSSLSEGAKISLLLLFQSAAETGRFAQSLAGSKGENSEEGSADLFRFRKLANECPAVDATHERDDYWWGDMFQLLNSKRSSSKLNEPFNTTGADVLAMLPDSAQESVSGTIKDREKQHDPDAFALRKGLKAPVTEGNSDLLWQTVASNAAEAAAPYIDKIQANAKGDHATQVILESCRDWFENDHQDHPDADRRKAGVLGLLKAYSDTFDCGFMENSNERIRHIAQMLQESFLASIGLLVHIRELDQLGVEMKKHG